MRLNNIKFKVKFTYPPYKKYSFKLGDVISLYADNDGCVDFKVSDIADDPKQIIGPYLNDITYKSRKGFECSAIFN